MKPLHALPIFVSALGLAIALGCDQAPNPVAPSGTILSATAVPSKISLSGEPSTLTVTGIRPDGNPIRPGTQITLSTTLGTLRPLGTNCSGTAVVTIIEADDRGQVGAILCGDGRGGEASIAASLTNSGTTGGSGGSGGSGGTGGSASGTTSVTIKVQIGETDASKPSLIMSANPSTVLACDLENPSNCPDKSKSIVSLLGRASDGTPVGAGQRIRLTAEQGTVTCDSSVRCPGEQSGPCNAVCTNSRGESQATFIASARSGEAKVTGILGTGDAVSVSLDVNSTVATVILTANPARVDRIDTGDTSELTAVAQDAQGNPLVGALVSFSFPNNPPHGTITPTNRVTDANGSARVELEAFPADLPATLRCFQVEASVTTEGIVETDIVFIGVDQSPPPGDPCDG